jgi:hypothetical protein
VEHGCVQLEAAFVESGARDAPVVDLHDPGTGRFGEVARELVPRTPRRRVVADQHTEAGGRDRLVLDPGWDNRAERLSPQQLEVKALVGAGGPRDRRVEAAVEHPSDLEVARHHPLIHPQLRPHGRNELIRQPDDIAEPQGARGAGEAPLGGGGQGEDLAGVRQ